MALFNPSTRPMGYKAPARLDINTTDAQYAQGVRQLDKPGLLRYGSGIGALQQITNPQPMMPPQALVREVAAPGPGQFGYANPLTGLTAPGRPLAQPQQRQVVSGTLAARALQSAAGIAPSPARPPAPSQPRLDQLRSTFSPQQSNPYGVNLMADYTPPGLNQTTYGAPMYKPPGLIPQFQNYQMAYKPPQPAPQPQNKFMTGFSQRPTTTQQQLAAQRARNK